MALNPAVLWSGLEALAGGGLGLAATMVIARVAGPGEVGLAAAAVAPNVVLWVVVTSLFADALVQRMERDPAVLATLFWSGLGLGLSAAAIQAALGPLLAEVIGDPRLRVMSLLLALPLPAVGMAGVGQGVLTRDGRYRALALRTAAGQGLGVACGVALALSGAGAWALVMQQVVTTAAGAAVLLGTMRWRPASHWRWSLLHPVLRGALPITAATLTQIARYRVFAVLLGSVADPAVLGQAHMAFRLVDAGRDLLFTALWRLFLPRLAAEPERAARLALVDRLGMKSSRFVLPACGLAALVMGPVVGLVLGPNWAEASAATVPLLWLTAVLAVMFPSGVALVATGGARYTLYGNLVTLAATIALVLLLRPASATAAALIWCAAEAAVLPYALWVNGRALGVGPLRPLAAAAGGLALAGAGLLLAAPWLALRV